MLRLSVFFGAILCLSLVACLLPGGFRDRDITEDEVVDVANFAAKALGQKFKTPFHAKLTKLKKAQSQVVAGTNYRLNVIVGLTTCKKAEVDYNDIDKCEYQTHSSTYRKCEVVIYEDLKGNRKLIAHACILASKNEI